MTVSVALAVLFAASRAVTVTTVVPAPSGTAAIVHAVVPVATPLPPRFVVQLTCVTPTSSLAVPLTSSVLLVAVCVPPLVGAVIVIVGAVVSGHRKREPAVLHGPSPPPFDVRIHQSAGARRQRHPRTHRARARSGAAAGRRRRDTSC